MFGEILAWYLVVFVLGALAFPIINLLLGNKLKDGGYGFAKIAGILTLAATTFQLNYIHIVHFDQWSIIGLGIVLLSIVALIGLKYPLFKNINWRWVVLEELIFAGVFAGFVLVKMLNPDIVSTEKFMNFGIINSILRMDYGPPSDMWYAPLVNDLKSYNGLNYYYFGHFVGALLIKLSGVRSQYGFNLFSATITALAAVETFSLVLNTTASWARELGTKIRSTTLAILGLIGAFVVNFSGNLQVLYAFSTSRGSDNPPAIWDVWTGVLDTVTYQFAAATRVFQYSINEIPSYSHVIGDVHGHVMALPITLLLLALLSLLFEHIRKQPKTTAQEWISKWRERTSGLDFWGFGLVGTVIGYAYMTNAADLLTYGGLSAVIILLFAKGWWNKLVLGFVTFFSVYTTTYQFNSHYSSIVKFIGINCAPDWLIRIQSFGPFLFEEGKCQRSEWYLLPIAWGVGLLGVLILIKFAVLKRELLKSVWMQWALLISAFGVVLIAVPEVVYFKDIYADYFRANTMFKLGFQAYVMLSLVFVYSIFLVWTHRAGLATRLAKMYTYGLRPIYLVVVVAIIGVTGIYIPLATNQYANISNTKNLSLDGRRWMDVLLPGENNLIGYINSNVQGQPTILEAFGESYTLYGRISVFTGLPTIANWRGHEWIWRANANVLDQRIVDAQVMYTNTDPNVLAQYYRYYGIKYVVVSDLERKAYPGLTTVGMEQLSDKVYEDVGRNIQLYKMR
jgi:uncharacterized membrane protein